MSDKKSIQNSEGDGEVVKTVEDVKNYPLERQGKIYKSLNEVEQIRKGKLPRKAARDFLKEMRGN